MVEENLARSDDRLQRRSDERKSDFTDGSMLFRVPFCLQEAKESIVRGATEADMAASGLEDTMIVALVKLSIPLND